MFLEFKSFRLQTFVHFYPQDGAVFPPENV